MAPGWKKSIGNVTDQVNTAAKRASSACANRPWTSLKSIVGGAAGGAAGGAILGSTAAAFEGVALNALGFTVVGPAASSIAGGWMSSIAVTNGVGVLSGSTYAALQSAAMGGGALLGAPFLIGMCATGTVVGALVTTVVLYKKRDGGGDVDGDAEGGDALAAVDSAKADEDEALSAENDGDAEEGDALAAVDSAKADEDEALSAENDVTEHQQSDVLLKP